MEIHLAPERIFLLEERLTLEEIQQRSMDRRTQAFGGGVSAMLQRPKPDDVAFIARQRRLEPFWHVAASARYVYDRTRDYPVHVAAPEVQEVTVLGTDYPVAEAAPNGRSFTIPVMEHCREELYHQLFADGVTGVNVADAPQIITGTRSEIPEPSTLATEETVVIPPEHRVSFVVRQLLSEMMKPVHADVMHEENIWLQATDLYYRPIWGFEFEWKLKAKRGVIEMDGLTGQMRNAPSLIPDIKKSISKDMLFDIGADTAGLLVPGGSIAVKLARAAIDKGY
jgi:hypothetical protein